MKRKKKKKKKTLGNKITKEKKNLQKIRWKVERNVSYIKPRLVKSDADKKPVNKDNQNIQKVK